MALSSLATPLTGRPVRKAVFPVAGLGTRFLPATKAMPKEMLPVVDKPLIQYAVEEAIAAGITQLIFITGRHKRAIEDHFDRAPELEWALQARGDHARLADLQAMSPPSVSFVYIRQTEPLGLGHAVLSAESLIGDEPFAVLLADDLIDGIQPAIGQLMALHASLPNGGCVVATQTVAEDQVSRYGIVDLGTAAMLTPALPTPRLQRVHGLVEKPQPAAAPSRCAVMGRYVLEPGIFTPLRAAVATRLHNATAHAGIAPKPMEIQLTDALSALIDSGVYAASFEGKRFDCGDKQGFLEATVHYAKRAGFRLPFVTVGGDESFLSGAKPRSQNS